MTKRKKALFGIPQGTEGFYLDEALAHKRLVAHIERLFYLWGYLPVQTPVFDFYDVYEPLLGPDHASAVYRMIDREGDLLMLRSDVTLFLAKQMGTMLRQEDLPARVYYGDTILRHQDPEDISKNEFFQSGVELIGVDGIEGDLEVLLLLTEVMDSLHAPRHSCHLGSRKLLSACVHLEPARLPRSLQQAVTMREGAAIREELERYGVAANAARDLTELFHFIGDADELDAFTTRVESHLPPAARTELQYVSELYRQLAALDMADRLRIDLSEVGTQPYHSGVAFQVYMEGADAAVCAGGRYDGLLSQFGFAASSVGFSMMLRKIQPLLEDSSGRGEKEEPRRAVGESVAERFREARELRRAGKVATL